LKVDLSQCVVGGDVYTKVLSKRNIMFTQRLQALHHHVVKYAPNVLTYPSQWLPFFVKKAWLTELLHRVFSDAIEDGEVDFLQGKWLKVSISDLQLTWFVSFNKNQFIIKSQVAQQDVSFTAAVNDLILVAGRKEDPDTLFFQRRLSIEGDTELALEIKNLLDNIEFEHLPPFIEKGMGHFADFVKQGLTLAPNANANANTKV